MRYAPIDSAFFITNRKNFCEKLKLNSVAIYNSNDEYNRNGDQNYPFRQNSDFFYLTGIEQEQSILILAPNHPDLKLREVLFLLEANEQLETWFGHKLTITEAQEISGIKTVMLIPRLELVLNEIILASENIYLNFNEYVKYSTEVLSRDRRFAEKLKEKYPAHKFERSAPILAELRTIKSDTEIALIQKAINITEIAFRRVLYKTKPQLKEYEVQAEIDYEFTRNGANGHAYAPIIATGINACTLHYIENNKVCEDGDMLLMDFGAEYGNYAADLTRTIPVNGKFTSRQRAIYDSVLRVQKEAIKMLVVGNTVDKLNKAVNGLMQSELLNLGLMTDDEFKDPIKASSVLIKYFMHGTSHYLGLDVHDVGSKYEEMKAGMVFTCEPALYIKEEGIGIRLENDILVTEEGPVDLMKNIPIEPDEIEALMNQSK
ncbi:MAG: aminopeptidase P N-terminal domain-containing protein [Bacteroidetes bacterium]|nr:aminopeptidase P N-terminal domain-containing protein [Bacteroidota bacterium]